MTLTRKRKNCVCINYIEFLSLQYHIAIVYWLNGILESTKGTVEKILVGLGV